MLVIAMWILRVQGSLWRSWVWEEAGAAVAATATALGGSVRPLWTGWRVRAPGLTVSWRGGALGPRTRVVVRGRGAARREELASAEAVLAEVARLRGEGAP